MDELYLTPRQRKLLHFLQNHENIITGSELAAQLNTTSRTIRSDIAVINRELRPFDARIDSIRSKGYFFTAQDPDKIRELNRINTAFTTREERIRYLATQLCLANEPICMYDFEDEMFISHTTLENDIRRLKLLYMMKSPYIKLINEHNTLAFEQDEKKRRLILISLFHEHWNYSSRENAIYGSEYISEDVLDQVIDIVSLCLHKYEIRMEDTNIVWLNLACTIMYERVSSGHILPEAPNISKTDSSALYAARAILERMETSFAIAFPPQEQDELYLFISSAHILEPTGITCQNAPYFFEQTVFAMADEYIHALNETYRLDFSGDEDFYITLLQYIRYILTPIHRFSTQENSCVLKSHLNIELELAWMFQETALRYTGNYLEENELLHLAYCLSGALEFYFTFHPEHKLNTVICCHEHMSVAWSIKRKILSSFEKDLDITLLVPVHQAQTVDFSHTDLILSTVHKKIADNISGKVIHISPYVSPNDIQKLEAYLQDRRISHLYQDTASIASIVETAYWHEGYEFPDIFSAIETLGGEFVEKQAAGAEFLSALLARESLCSNACCSGLLFQFALVPARKTQLSFMVLPHRMNWNIQKIRVIATASFTAEDRPLMFKLKNFFHNLNRQYDIANLIHNQQELTELLRAQPDFYA